MIGVGVLGYGSRGAAMARCTAELDRSVLRGIADHAPDALRRAALRHPDARLVNDWRDLVADMSTDAIIVATPVDTHFEIALAALRAGKHVLVGAPFTSTTDQAGLLVQEAAHRQRVLMVAHTVVYTAAVAKMKDLVGGGDIGEPCLYESVRISAGGIRNGSNEIWGAAIDDLAIIDHVIGSSPVGISVGAPRNMRGVHESMVYISLYFDDGMVSHLNVSWLAPIEIRQTLIAGSRRMIVYDDVEPSIKIKVYDRGEAGPTARGLDGKLALYRTGDMWAPHLPAKEAELTEIEHFVECILHGREPLTSGMSGLRVVRVLEAAMASLRHQGHPVELQALKRAM